MIKTPAQRKAEWEDNVEGVDLATLDGVDLALTAATDLDIGKVTAMKYITALASELNVTLPEMPTKTRSSSKWRDTVAAFNAEEALDGDRDAVIAKLQDVGEYEDTKKAAANYNRLRKEFGWVAPKSMAQQLSEWYIEQYQADPDAIDKVSITEKAKEIGMTEGSIGYYVGVFKITGDVLTVLA